MNFSPKGKLFRKKTDSFNFKMFLYKNKIGRNNTPANTPKVILLLTPVLIGNNKF